MWWIPFWVCVLGIFIFTIRMSELRGKMRSCAIGHAMKLADGIKQSGRLVLVFAGLAVIFGIIGMKKNLNRGGEKPKIDQQEEQLSKYLRGEWVARKNAWWLDRYMGGVDEQSAVVRKIQFKLEKMGIKMNEAELTRAFFHRYVIQYNPILLDELTSTTTKKNPNQNPKPNIPIIPPRTAIDYSGAREVYRQ